MNGRGLIVEALAPDHEVIQPPLNPPLAAIAHDGAVHVLTVRMGKTPDHGSIHEAASGATIAPRQSAPFRA
jgi:hypothetical protein